MPELADAIDKIKSQFESVQALMRNSERDLSATMAEHKKWSASLATIKQEHAAKVSELEAKKVAAERAAEENARRIKLNNDQVHELERIRTDLNQREKAVVQREQAAARVVAENSAKLAAVVQRESEVDRKEQEISRRWAKMREAIG